ncbi:MAG: hypothetical protein AAFX99_25890, partial [Myxococcota bacterium]
EALIVVPHATMPGPGFKHTPLSRVAPAPNLQTPTQANSVDSAAWTLALFGMVILVVMTLLVVALAVYTVWVESTG